MHPAVPVVGMALNLLQEMAEHSARKQAGQPFVGMLAKRKHELSTAGSISTGEINTSGGLLQPGRYWIDIFGDDNLEAFELWLAMAGPNVTVENREHYDGYFTHGLPPVYNKPREWILFTVVNATPWGSETAKLFGRPTVAASNVHTSDDTVQKPTAESTLPWWQGGDQGSAWSSLGTPWKVLIIGGVIVFAGVLALKVAR